LRVLGFTILISLGTCLIFGLVPAWQASQPDLHTALEQSGRTSGPGASRLRFRQLLVVFQVSVAVMLVIGAGLLIRSFWILQRVDPGFQSEGVLTSELILPYPKYAENTQINNFYNQLLERVPSIPGVKNATIAYDHPLSSNWLDEFEIEGRVVSPDGPSQSANFIPIGPDYFDTVGLRLAAGRRFTPQDDPDHPGVAIVNESFVKHYFPTEDALGRRLKPSPPAPPPSPRPWKSGWKASARSRPAKNASSNSSSRPHRDSSRWLKNDRFPSLPSPPVYRHGRALTWTP